MKALITIAFLSLTHSCFSQDSVAIDLITTYRPVTIGLIKDCIQITSSQATNDGKFIYKNLQAGSYKLQISGQGKNTEVRNDIVIKEGQRLELNIKLNGPCLYDHPPDYMPICPENHTDNIVSIVYGLVIFADQNSRDKVHLGGCVVTECDPKYYCTIHKKKF